MAFPLGSSSVSNEVEYLDSSLVAPDGAVCNILELTISSRTTVFSQNNNLLVRHDRSTSGIEFLDSQFIGPDSSVNSIMEITVSRTWWAGLGGTIFVPSFPQLDRQATSFPHAF